MSALPEFTIKELLEAGVHFGHKTRRWNPKMQEFIHSEKNGVHILDLRKTAPMLHQALVKVKEVVSRNGRIVFVGTKPQAQLPVAEAAQKCGQFFINKRWLGGTLTNWQTISESIRTLRKYEGLINEEGSGLKKKERLEIARKNERLEASIGGIKELGGTPDLLIVIDTRKDDLAIKEANKLGIPVIAVLDSNCDPEGIDYPIPGNDDSIRAIKLYCKLFSDAVLAGIEESLTAVKEIPAQVANENVAQAEAETAEVPAEEAAEGEAEEAAKAKVETVVKKSRAVKKPKEEKKEEKAEEAKEEKVEKKPAKKPAAKKTAKKETKETKKEEK